MRRAYLDTCIISGLARGDLSSSNQSAMHEIVEQVRSSNLTVCASTEVESELLQVPSEHRQPHMDVYSDLAILSRSTEWLDPSGIFTGDAKPVFQRLQKILPDDADAKHITHAAMHQVADFITTDERTILRYREEVLGAAGVSAFSPAAYLEVLSRST